jgi:hypothetical protein
VAEIRKGQKRTRHTMDVICSDSELGTVERPGRRPWTRSSSDRGIKGGQAAHYRPAYLCFRGQDDQEASGRERWRRTQAQEVVEESRRCWPRVARARSARAPIQLALFSTLASCPSRACTPAFKSLESSSETAARTLAHPQREPVSCFCCLSYFVCHGRFS